MIYLFDTSAINHLRDDPACDAIVAGLQATGVIRVSVLNVVEAVGTADVTLRQSLLRLLKRLTGMWRPLEFPNVLVRRAIEAYGHRSPELNHSIDEAGEAYWHVLHHPEDCDEAMRAEVNAKRLALEEEFVQGHRDARSAFQELFAGGCARPRRPPALLRAYAQNSQFLHDVINPLFRGTHGRDLPVAEVRELLRVVPEVAGFLAGWGHSVHQRAISRCGHGRKNAGTVDLWFGAYLPRVDRFVTADHKQYLALRLIARMVAPRCGVIEYEVFRRRLLVAKSASA